MTKRPRKPLAPGVKVVEGSPPHTTLDHEKLKETRCRGRADHRLRKLGLTLRDAEIGAKVRHHPPAGGPPIRFNKDELRARVQAWHRQRPDLTWNGVCGKVAKGMRWDGRREVKDWPTCSPSTVRNATRGVVQWPRLPHRR